MWWTVFNGTSFLLRQSWHSTFLYPHLTSGEWVSFSCFVHSHSCISMYICASVFNHIFCMINEHCSANTTAMATHGLVMVYALLIQSHYSRLNYIWVCVCVLCAHWALLNKSRWICKRICLNLRCHVSYFCLCTNETNNPRLKLLSFV